MENDELKIFLLSKLTSSFALHFIPKNSVAASLTRDICHRRIGRLIILIQPVRMMLVSVPWDVNGVGFYPVRGLI
jgi:hypothetical protein